VSILGKKKKWTQNFPPNWGGANLHGAEKKKKKKRQSGLFWKRERKTLSGETPNDQISKKKRGGPLKEKRTKGGGGLVGEGQQIAATSFIIRVRFIDLKGSGGGVNYRNSRRVPFGLQKEKGTRGNFRRRKKKRTRK